MGGEESFFVPQTEPLSVNVIVCEHVLTEKTELLSAIRILDTLTIQHGYDYARFSVVTIAVSNPGDIGPHVLKVVMTTSSGQQVASAPDCRFEYGYKIDPIGFGGFRLTTQFAVDLRPLDTLGQFMIWVYLDGAPVAQAPIMLRRSYQLPR